MAVELKSFSPGPGGKENPTFIDDEDQQSTVAQINDVKIDINGGNGTIHGSKGEQDDDEEEGNGDCCSRMTYQIQTGIRNLYRQNSKLFKGVIIFLFIALYFAYFGYAMYYSFGDEPSWRLLGFTVFAMLFISGRELMQYNEHRLEETWKLSIRPCLDSANCKRSRRISSVLLKIVVAGAIAAFVIIDVIIDHPQNLISFAGLAIYVVLFYISSVNPSKIRWHPVFWGISLQFIFAILILRTRAGYDVFMWCGDRVTEFLNYSTAGSIFVFGPGYAEHNFAFKVLPIVTFFYSIISLLYYLGVMQFIVRNIGRFLAFCMGTAPGESLNAAGNILVGMTEAPLMIQPLLADMTVSELHAVCTGGFSTIAGTVLGAYINFGAPASHLLSASFMSAPAALAISKLSYPELELSTSSTKDYYKMGKAKERNVFEAVSVGATNSIKIIGAIAVNVMAFLSILQFVDATLMWFGERVGYGNITFEFICSYLFYPFAFFMGVETGDCRSVAGLVGIKTFVNEFAAYEKLGKLIDNNKNFTMYTQSLNFTDWYKDGDDIILPMVNQTLTSGILQTKSVVISTYALCGFSNFGAIGIMLGGIGALAPSRKTDLSRIMLRAMIAGNAACLMTGCISGLFYKDY